MADQIGRQCWQSIVLVICPAVFDRDVLALDIAGLFQASTERGQEMWVRTGRLGAEPSDHRHRRLLRPRRERPCGSCPAEQRDERAAFHVWMAPAWQEKM